MQTQAIQGPIAVPASQLETTLRVQTRVNGELRQNATTQDLIFSIPYLIKTMSEGQTLVPGDVLATGTVCIEPCLDDLKNADAIIACWCWHRQEPTCLPQGR
jgi:2-keto-4-pentenoate hydratase/2-oxohepta-3-ene-1,7-dioic acid hydratase in catechol pathway